MPDVSVARRRFVLGLAVLPLALPLAGGAVRSDTHVLLDHGRVSIHSESTPLADVLSRFAQATGAEVVYEAARPRQLVSVAIEAGSAAEAIARLLEGQGLNYALRLDPTGRNVEMLVITGSASPLAAAAGAARTARPAPPAVRPPEEEEEEDEVPPGNVNQPFAPDASEGLDPSAPPGTSPGDAVNSAPGAPWPGAAPGAPPGLESSSPESTAGTPMNSPAPEPGQPQLPAPASYPGGVPVSPPVLPQPVYPRPPSYPGGV